MSNYLKKISLKIKVVIFEKGSHFLLPFVVANTTSLLVVVLAVRVPVIIIVGTVCGLDIILKVSTIHQLYKMLRQLSTSRKDVIQMCDCEQAIFVPHFFATKFHYDYFLECLMIKFWLHILNYIIDNLLILLKAIIHVNINKNVYFQLNIAKHLHS